MTLRRPVIHALVALAALASWPQGAARLRAQSPGPLTPTPLHWVDGPLALRGPALPSGYLGVEGRRAAAFGTPTGDLEVWAWPLRLVHGFHLSFQTPLYPDPIPADQIARRVEVTPAGATITYTHAAFTVRERIFAPLDEPAIVIVLEVRAVRPMEIVASFHSDLQLAWPGGIGGQYIFWDDTAKAFELTEGRREYNAFVGSPYATRATTNPTWSLPDAPSEMRIAVGDQTPVAMPSWQEPAGRRVNVVAHGIPIVLVGGIEPRDSVLAIYRRVLAHVGELYAQRVAHADSVVAATAGFGDTAVNLRARWAELNLDEALVCNPDLGCGPVAGYGPAGPGSYRPGFAWFFGGDAAINSLALASVGAFDLARQYLRFFARYRRADGKIPHETSQSAARVPWFTAYPYPYWHGDTTPFWLLALSELFRASADTAYVRSLWPHIERAYHWCVGTVGADGLMKNPLAGVGAIEVGHLGADLRSDIYLSAVWVQALKRLSEMAGAVGDTALAADAARRYPVAHRSLENEFWMPRARRYAFAILQGDSLNDNLTVWPATAMSWGLFEDARGQDMATQLAGATIATDWGARTLSSESPLFDPLHYNNGTVWPFVTGFLSLAEYRYHNPYTGSAQLDAIGRTFSLWGLGDNPEVFSGSSFEPLETAVPQQFFSTSAYLSALVRGAYGLRPDAPHGALTLEPHLFERPGRYTVRGVRVGAVRLDVDYAVSDTAFTATVRRTGGSDAPVTLELAPALAPGSRILAVRANGERVTYRTAQTGRDVHIYVEARLGREAKVTVRHTAGWRLEVAGDPPRRGDRSRALKVLDARLEGDTLVASLEGLAGRLYRFQVFGPGRGGMGRLRADSVRFPAGPGDAQDGYTGAVIRLLP